MKKHFQNLLTFVVIFLIVNMIVNFFFKGNNEADANKGKILITPSHTEFEMGTVVTADVKNYTSGSIVIKNNCPGEPLSVFANQNGQWVQKQKQAEINCDGTTDVTINPGDKHTFTFNSWNHTLFGTLGKYKIQAAVFVSPGTTINTGTEMTTQAATQTQTATASVTVSAQTQTATTAALQSSTQQTTAPTAVQTPTKTIVESDEFTIKEQGILGYLWTTIFFQPIYNALIFLISITPGRDLGFGIILLTLIIRTILMLPNQKALESQRKLQEVQPKLNKIREKYKDNQEMIGKETLAIMQEHKVNPMGSCLPMLIQFPILIALYYSVQNGLNPDNAYILYGGLKTFAYNMMNVHFLGILDLTKVNAIILPLFVGGLQFLQMKLALARTSKNKQQHPNAEKEPKNDMDSASKMMIYFMPALIAIFTASVPAGVGIYWSVSTLYGIGQQLVVNAKLDREKVKVRVIESK